MLNMDLYRVRNNTWIVFYTAWFCCTGKRRKLFKQIVLRCMVQHLPCHQSIDRICQQMGCTMATSHDWNLDITQQDSWLGVQALWLSHTKWWLSHPLEKYESQIGSSSQLLGKKIKFMFQTTNQICSVYPCWWSHKHRPQTTADLHQRWALQTTASPKKTIETPTFREAKLRHYGHPVDVHQFLDAIEVVLYVLGLPTRLSPHFRQNSASGINLRFKRSSAPTRVDLNFSQQMKLYGGFLSHGGTPQSSIYRWGVSMKETIQR